MLENSLRTSYKIISMELKYKNKSNKSNRKIAFEYSIEEKIMN